MRHLALLPVATAITLVLARTATLVGSALLPTASVAAPDSVVATHDSTVAAPATPAFSRVAMAPAAAGSATPPFTTPAATQPLPQATPQPPPTASTPVLTPSDVDAGRAPVPHAAASARPRVRAVAPLPEPIDARWAPPAWLPGPLASALPLLDAPARATDARPPQIRAPRAILADLDRGEVLWARRPDAPAPVASLTKLASALALVSIAPDGLDRRLCITPEQWPVRPGAHSRFETGACHTGWELFGAALVHSDNRGAMAMPALGGLSMDAFVEQMNAVSRELGTRAEWADPSGLDDGNAASARDMLKLAVAAAAHPDVALAASARSWKLDRDHGARVVGTTNRTIDTWETLAAKTGYTDTAKYCFTTVIRTRTGRTLALAVLGAPNDDARFADARALVAWAESLDNDAVADAGTP